MVARQPIVARKRLGQNFLHDLTVIRRIVASLDLRTTDTVLEIGCGAGALTRYLAAKPRQFIGVELDKDLFQRLEDQYSGSSVLFLNQDILKLDLTALMRKLQLPSAKLKVVGNLPYYISSPIIEWLGKQAAVIESATIMLQAEVADRLMASPGIKEFGVLTLVTNYYFTCRKLMEVRPGAFRPAPKVYSTVLRLEPKAQQMRDLDLESAFFAFIKQSFSQRRKTLWNCLKGSVDKGSLEALLDRLGHSPDCRAEVLSLEDLIFLFSNLPTENSRSTVN
jgi:16S rRNA (adenine1518-N6/adenine1519-N6)-dimethyltransferase